MCVYHQQSKLGAQIDLACWLKMSWPGKGGRNSANCRCKIQLEVFSLFLVYLFDLLISPHTPQGTWVCGWFWTPGSRPYRHLCRLCLAQHNLTNLPSETLDFDCQTRICLPTVRSCEMPPQLFLILVGSLHSLPHHRDAQMSLFGQVQRGNTSSGSPWRSDVMPSLSILPI